MWKKKNTEYVYSMLQFVWGKKEYNVYVYIYMHRVFLEEKSNWHGCLEEGKQGS